ncbi:MAG: hypothetical protein KIT52_17690 [Anaerolineae bacterium]|nr:hypothetical protein [Anaerolineae bacterium]
MDDALLWAVRAYVYGHFAATTRPPTAAGIAAHFDISPAAAEATLRALHDRHALFLEPGATAVRLANPFSGVPTPYRVTAGGLTYTANCAWDSFGIPVALGAAEARITAVCAGDGRAITLDVRGGELDRDGPEVAHFLIPFRQWYDDLIHT